MKRSELAISASLVPIDYLMVLLAGIMAYYVRFWEPIKDIRPIIFNLPFGFFFNWLLIFGLLWSASFVLAGLYSMRGTSRWVDELSKIILACSTAVMILMFVFFFSRSLFDSRFIILAGWFFSILFVSLGRGLVRFIQRRFYYFGVGIHRVVVIGEGRLAQDIVVAFSKNIKSGYRVVEQFSGLDNMIFKKMETMKQEDKFDEILVATPNLDSVNLEKLNDFSYLNHVELKYIADIFDFPINNFTINNIAGFPIVELKKTKLDGWGRVYKRIFDVVLSVLIIIAISPILIVTAFAIKFDSPGPIIYKNGRIGKGGKFFKLFKFRSMFNELCIYDEKESKQAMAFEKELINTKNTKEGPLYKIGDDPRVTTIGRFIRRYSIDELPQLFNVLKGDISLVGPRPHQPREIAKYERHHKKVMSIKPGITGMAQVSGRSDLDFDEEVRLDVWYMENWSMKLDLLILFKTPLAVLKKRQAE